MGGRRSWGSWVRDERDLRDARLNGLQGERFGVKDEERVGVDTVDTVDMVDKKEVWNPESGDWRKN